MKFELNKPQTILNEIQHKVIIDIIETCFKLKPPKVKLKIKSQKKQKDLDFRTNIISDKNK